MMARTLLLKNAQIIATMDDAGRELADASVLIRGGVIEAVGTGVGSNLEADEVIDCAGQVLLPGMINTHHHFFQTLTRAVPGAQDAELFDWLVRHYPIWAGLTPEMMHVAALTAMAELMMSGCTTSSDHQYIYPNGITLDDSISAAAAIGMRFHATRGAMTVGESQGGLPPDRVCESEAGVLRDYERLVARYHDRSHGAMLRVSIAPCSPFSVSQDFMRESALFARRNQVRLHTHLAENDSDITYTRDKFSCTPAEYCERLEWLGADVWHAHCVKLDRHGIERFAATGTGVAHCPSSNMRLASGIAPIRAMLDAGVPLSIAVDGSASNDSSHYLAEVRQAMLLQRVGGNPAGLSAREALRMATRGGARVFGRDDIGQITPGACADVVTFDLGALDYAGAGHDPIAALVFAAPRTVCHSIIAGRVTVRGGELVTLDLGPHVARHNRLARQLVSR